MRSKVRVTTPAFGLLGVVGPKAGPLLAEIFSNPRLAAADPGACWPLPEGGRLWADPRHPDFGWRLLIGAEHLPGWWDRLAAAPFGDGRITPAGSNAWGRYRIEHALPRGGDELMVGESLPLESGFLELHGVDFSKGCYIGQETTARTHHRGTIRKRLYRVAIMAGADPNLAAGAAILLPDGKEAGILTSVHGWRGRWLGLAIIRADDVAAGRPLTVAGHPLAEISAPPWAGWR